MSGAAANDIVKGVVIPGEREQDLDRRGVEVDGAVGGARTDRHEMVL